MYGTTAAPALDRSWIISASGSNVLTLNQDGAGAGRVTISNSLIANLNNVPPANPAPRQFNGEN